MASLLSCLAETLLGDLSSSLFQHYVGNPWGFGSGNEFVKLKNTVTSIGAVLLDAEEKQRTNHHVQDWLTKIKPVFYDLEDLLQEISSEALKRHVMTKNKMAKEVHIFFSSSNQVMYRLKMGRKVKLIREQLDAIALDSNRFNFIQRLEGVSPITIRSNRREDTHSYMPLDKFVGRDGDKKDVTRLLLDESDASVNVSVVSIVGIGGLGKTALAQSIYSSEEVIGNFELMMWVCVSDVFDVKVVCEKIIECATKNACERLQMDVVKDKLKNIIDGKKYLLVLDDVWNECPIKWTKLAELLTSCAKGSKILITARAKLVAKAAKSTTTHVLGGLSPEESWTLFKQVAFKRGVEQESPTIVGIGKEVVEICSGVPLAIKVIGSMLGIKEKEIDWLDFKKNDLPLITQDSEGKVLPILKLSYDYLSAPLKRIFVYCAIFPKDYKIPQKRLIMFLMAQGLIQLDGTTRSLEEVGERHLMDLLDRSFFDLCDKYGDGTVCCYKMHDLIHDLAQSLGKDEYFNLGSDVIHIDISTRHAWVSGKIPTNLLHAKKLRTLVVKDLRDEFDGHKVTEIMSISKQMRVLHLPCLKIMRVSHFVGGLTHLNYLNLSDNTFDFLPESICNLYNLQTLILWACRNLKELPKGLRNLVSLSHLDIDGCDKLSHMPRGLEELTCLKTLSGFVMRGAEGRNCAELGELRSLVNLRGDLSIRNLRGSKGAKCKRSESFILIHLRLIRCLKLSWSGEGEVVDEEEEEARLSLFESLKPHSNLEKLRIVNYGGKRFPSWMDTVNIGVSFPNIVNISVDRCKRLRHLPPFGLLPSLRELRLYSIHSMEYLYDISGGGGGSGCTPNAPDQLFPSLKLLDLYGMPKLTRLVGPVATSRFKENNRSRHFPVLEKLTIWGCPLLFVSDGSDENGKQFQSLTSLRVVTLQETETLPAWLQFLPHLQILDFSHCNKIVSLPDWVGNLTSLHEFRVRFCSSLASIPYSMRRLTSLQRLIVVGCNKLVRRCQNETGEDWPSIAHIPNISMTAIY